MSEIVTNVMRYVSLAMVVVCAVNGWWLAFGIWLVALAAWNGDI